MARLLQLQSLLDSWDKFLENFINAVIILNLGLISFLNLWGERVYLDVLSSALCHRVFHFPGLDSFHGVSFEELARQIIVVTVLVYFVVKVDV